MNTLDQEFLQKIERRVLDDRIRWLLANPIKSLGDFKNADENGVLGPLPGGANCYGVVLWAGHLDHLVGNFGSPEGFNEGHGYYYLPNPQDGPPIVGPAVFAAVIERFGSAKDLGGAVVFLREKNTGSKKKPIWRFTHGGLLSDGSDSALTLRKMIYMAGIQVTYLDRPVRNSRDKTVYFPKNLNELSSCGSLDL